MVKPLNRLLIILLLTLSAFLPSFLSAATWYIKPDGTGDAPDIQAGITAAANGDTVLLAAGTYTGLGNRDIDFLGKAIVLTSESGPYVTIIDCQNSGGGVIFKSSEGAGSVLSDLTITNANTGVEGGGVFCDNTSPQIINNLIVGNHTTKLGGGIYVKAGSPTIMNNTIVDNSADV